MHDNDFILLRSFDSFLKANMYSDLFAQMGIKTTVSCKDAAYGAGAVDQAAPADLLVWHGHFDKAQELASDFFLNEEGYCPADR